MKSLISSVAFAALVSLSCLNAMAGWLPTRTGSMANGTFTTFSPLTGALNGQLGVTDFVFGSGAGAFNGLASQNDVIFAGSSTFPALGGTIGASYTFSNSAFGTFVGTITSDNTSGAFNQGTGVGTRQLGFTGTFTPGNSGFYASDTLGVNSVMQITFGRNGFDAQSASWSLSTQYTAPAVPEPTSIAIFGLGAAGFAVRRFRRK
jgi:hypothetical protein